MLMSLKGQDSERGSIVMGLMAMVIVGGLMVFFLKGKTKIFDVATLVMRDSTQLIEFYSAVETAVHAYSQEELYYLRTLTDAGCPGMNSFSSALKKGSGCNAEVVVFKSYNDDTDLIYKRNGVGCTIKKTQTECGSSSTLVDEDFAPVHLLDVERLKTNTEIGVVSQNTFSFYLFSVLPEKGYVEVVTLIKSNDPKTGKSNPTVKKAFAIKNTISTLAHLEINGDVVHENPSPLLRCNNSAWSTINVFNPDTLTCLSFNRFGGATGLAYYNGRYFGLRPSDGKVIDMYAGTVSTSSYIVPETGIVSGSPIFPVYDADVLKMAEDITTIDDELYYLKGLGDHAQVGYLPAGATTGIKICDLGDLNYGVGYVGIAAHSTSQSVSKLDEDGYAMFALKTDMGDLLTAHVIVDPVLQKRDCFVTKESILQQVEYTRTMGFERTADESRVIFY